MSPMVTVHVRHVSGDRATVERLSALLDEHELGRAGRHASPDRYVTAHALLRTVVAESTGLDPRRVAFERVCATCGSTAHGKPVVSGYPELFVSMSYAGELALVAVTELGATGVDVERFDEADFEGFNAVTLADEEVPAFDAVRGESLAAARACVWARKEAVLKASGHGLVVDPRQVVVTGPQSKAGLVDWRGDRPLASVAHLHDVPLREPGYAAAVAVLGADAVEVSVRT